VTPEGLGKTFAINHLAPFILTHLVLDLIRTAPAGEKSWTASSSSTAGHLDFSNLQGERRYNWLGAYKRSKLCNILFTYELARRPQERRLPLTALAPDPRLRAWAITCGVYLAVFSLDCKAAFHRCLAFPRAARPAITPVYVASSPDLGRALAADFSCGAKRRAPKILRTTSMPLHRLWNMSEADVRDSAPLRYRQID